MSDDARLTDMERRALARMDAHTEELRAMGGRTTMRYRRIDPEIVDAWQYTGGGVMPEGCREDLERRHAHWCNHEITRYPDRVYALSGMTPPAPGERHDYWSWGEDGDNRCYAGDWIVRDDDGRLSIWSDHEFHAAFAPDDDAGERG